MQALHSEQWKALGGLTMLQVLQYESGISVLLMMVSMDYVKILILQYSFRSCSSSLFFFSSAVILCLGITPGSVKVVLISK